MHDNVVEINNLTLPYCFNKFSIKFPKEKLIVISGPNNCGKTTLIRILDSQIKTKNQVFFGTVGLEHYQITDLATKIKAVIPGECYFIENTLEQEINRVLINKQYKNNKHNLKEIIKKYKLTKYQNSNPNTLNNYLKIKLSLVLSFLYKPTLLLLDDIFNNLSKSEKEDLKEIITTYKKENKISIIMTCSKLEDSLFSDILYIIKDNEIVLSGPPMEVLQNDNIINKTGLELPFMIDLSVKLRDYDLIQTIETDMDRLVNILWR